MQVFAEPLRLASGAVGVLPLALVHLMAHQLLDFQLEVLQQVLLAQVAVTDDRGDTRVVHHSLLNLELQLFYK